jgi:hypothetical protein
VVFAPDEGSNTDGEQDDLPTTTVIATTSAPASGELTIHGPGKPPPALVAGGITIMPDEPLAADSYELDLGCVVVTVASMPASSDVPAACLGTDANLDVLVRGYVGTGAAKQLVGFAAGRVLLNNTVGIFEPPTWTTMTTSVPVMIDPTIDPVLDWTLYADTLPFDVDAPVDGSGELYPGLMVDRIVLDATIAGDGTAQQMMRELPAMPDSVTVGPADFLARIASGISVDDPSQVTIHWDEAGPPGADLVHARVAWSTQDADDDGSAAPVIWDVVLAPGADALGFPDTDGAVDLPADDAPITTLLRFIDSTGVADFPSVQTAGIYATSSTDAPSPIVDPTAAELRLSTASN